MTETREKTSYTKQTVIDDYTNRKGPFTFLPRARRLRVREQEVVTVLQAIPTDDLYSAYHYTNKKCSLYHRLEFFLRGTGWTLFSLGTLGNVGLVAGLGGLTIGAPALLAWGAAAVSLMAVKRLIPKRIQYESAHFLMQRYTTA